ncbi:xaa-Pro aminopeptidase 1-like [Gordionus sp. m RMFG-2023]|uniref:xaa-Pro aminopeptidase 1-like n=1 Tax=Gordionus sp. m RMFG-2023 TaxID=3053472 RepID=UPI0031FE28A3
MKDGIENVPTKEEWLHSVLQPKSRVGIDPTLISQLAWKQLEQCLKKNKLILVPLLTNLVDITWINKPTKPNNPVFCLDIKYTGKNWQSKINDVIDIISKHKPCKVSSLLISALDEIAWLLNLRGSDVPYNPVFFSYMIINVCPIKFKQESTQYINGSHTRPEIILFYGDGKGLNDEVMDHLGMDNLEIKEKFNVMILPYSSVYAYVKNIDWVVMGEDYKIWVSPQTNQALCDSIPHSDLKDSDIDHLIIETCPVMNLKAIKNDTEIEGAKKAHLLDAITLCEFFAWLTLNVSSAYPKITEVNAAAKLLEIRTLTCNSELSKPFMGLSFATISSSGPHSAVIHYHPNELTDRALSPQEVYLCDSGSQYTYGTTDVTRTLYLGTQEPDTELKKNYTLVLKGHLALTRAVFPKNCKGYRLDVLARQYLWDNGLDYLHGTGHGVGSFLNVHEGPAGISTRPSSYDCDAFGLQENMLMTIEPGYYEAQNYGIRIENTCYVIKAKTKNNFNEIPFLTFESLTLVPYQSNLIDQKLLTQQEINQINEYHRLCRDLVGKELEQLGKLDALNWLRNQAMPIPDKKIS